MAHLEGQVHQQLAGRHDAVSMTNPESGASSQQTPGKPWWKYLGTWLVVALLSPVIAGIAVAWITGMFEEHPPRPPKLTEERYVRPFSADGRLQNPYRVTRAFQTGDCWMYSTYSSDPDALRCTAADETLDPCWSWSEVAVCFNSPWDPGVTAIKTATRPSAGPQEDKDALPWALEIRDPSHENSTLRCSFVGGAISTVAGMRANWMCSLPGKNTPIGSALGDVTRSQTKPWTVLYNQDGSSEVLKADVITVWH